MNYRTKVIESFKTTLIENKNFFCKWKDITEYTKNNMVKLYSSNSSEITDVLLRQDIIKVIRNDKEWCKENGFPISMNSVGIKLSQDQKEIKEYISRETSRFLQGLKNLNEIKLFYNELVNKENYALDYTEQIIDKLEQENIPSQDGIESAGEVDINTNVLSFEFDHTRTGPYNTVEKIYRIPDKFTIKFYLHKENILLIDWIKWMKREQSEYSFKTLKGLKYYFKKNYNCDIVFDLPIPYQYC